MAAPVDTLAATREVIDLEMGDPHCLSDAFAAEDFSDAAVDAASIEARTVLEVKVIALLKAMTEAERRDCWQRADQTIWNF